MEISTSVLQFGALGVLTAFGWIVYRWLISKIDEKDAKIDKLVADFLDSNAKHREAIAQMVEALQQNGEKTGTEHTRLLKDHETMMKLLSEKAAGNV